MKRTYGHIERKDGQWVIDDVEPHVAIKLKSLFQHIPKGRPAPFFFKDTWETCADLIWLMVRYPLRVSKKDYTRLVRERRKFIDRNDKLETLLAPDYKPSQVKLKDKFEARDYQVKGKTVAYSVKRILIGDELGLGKTVIGILLLLEAKTLPAFIVVQTHLVAHWEQQIEKFTNLSICIIKGTKPYNIPEKNVYIIKYSCLRGWVDTFRIIPYKTVIYDEVQELRREKSLKWDASQELSHYAHYVLGLSATPIYNYGAEIFNIMETIKPNALGTRQEFRREWVSSRDIIGDPRALGTYMRENFLFLRRTREEVGRELPMVNTIVHTVDYDEQEVKKSEDLMHQLALKVMHGSFTEQGQAARELDIRARHLTGVSKARYVAQFVKFLVESGEPVVLAGWHRDVYDIWKKELGEFNPVMFTGSESQVQKERSKQAFINEETDIIIMSLRSGIGLDGLQYRCRTVIFGELDWSPKIHDQLTGRVDRDGQKHRVTAIYLISNYGSDLPIIDLLGVKSSQSHYMLNELGDIPENYSDESRMKLLAQQYLKNQKVSNEMA